MNGDCKELDILLFLCVTPPRHFGCLERTTWQTVESVKSLSARLMLFLKAELTPRVIKRTTHLVWKSIISKAVIQAKWGAEKKPVYIMNFSLVVSVRTSCERRHFSFNAKPYRIFIPTERAYSKALATPHKMDALFP